MNALVCEMCGSQDFVKQDGVFVCQHCRTKYSVEEAKRMMIEGTVDVKGTVKVDNSAFIEKYLQNARRALSKKDWEEVEKYYNMVEQNEPDNIEAIFYSSYGKVMMAMVDSDYYKREQKCEVFCNSISVIDDNYDVNKSSENQKLITQMSNDLFVMYNCRFVYNTKQYTDSLGITSTTDDSNKTRQLFAKISLSFVDSLNNIQMKDNRLIYDKLLFFHYKYLSSVLSIAINMRIQYREKCVLLYNKIKAKDSSFNDSLPPEIKTGGCYVATCVYGSYDCPEVWTLRRYRDFTLAKTWYGRAFIRTYYTISPTLVKWFGNTNWFRRMWKGKLDRMVGKLQDKGYESTQYYDR